MDKKKYGIISILAGGILGIYCWITISNDMSPQSLFDSYYTYEAPLTPHEITMIMLCIVAAIAVIVGMCTVYSSSSAYGSYSEKEQTRMNSSNSIYNAEKQATRPTTQNNDLLQNGGWKCTCGRINPSYTGTCACGKQKNSIQNEEEKKKVAPKESQRQQQTQSAVNADDIFEEIKKYKELLDSGIITEEEFNKKKTELLGL